ncbi:hypothetical protein BK673_24495 [Pseudomonas fluorescens]|uniref:DUF4435 domain-containing protein n=1 Tax=Pseudomonas fluorescens TaxID=294 RepID=A0A423P070_PSEFL|nr:DUF4435 domain-containing protein [Pseudomonas fluorescens]ROO03841.1 hypothetical protein BK673_24495 [Pseudomonas fluorescens]
MFNLGEESDDALPQFTADELLNLAIVSKTPVIFVEGYDDVPIFERLAEEVEIRHDIYASEAVKGGIPGCEGVIKHIQSIREISEGIDLEKYVLGIIDRDVRTYRNEVPQDTTIFTLNLNSIESHYVHPETIEYLAPKFTRAGPKLLNKQVCLDMFREISIELNNLYYVSLEALKKSCVADYSSLFGYKQSIKAIKHQNLHIQVLEKKEELDSFASTLGITCTFENLLLICKGKWLADTFGDQLYESIAKLPALCAEAKIPQCQLCKAQDPQNKCLYKKSMQITADLLLGHAYINTSIPTLTYIKEKLKTFGMLD